MQSACFLERRGLAAGWKGDLRQNTEQTMAETSDAHLMPMSAPHFLASIYLGQGHVAMTSLGQLCHSRAESEKNECGFSILPLPFLQGSHDSTLGMMFSQVGSSLNCCHDTGDSYNREPVFFCWPSCEREINLQSVMPLRLQTLFFTQHSLEPTDS